MAESEMPKWSSFVHKFAPTRSYQFSYAVVLGLFLGLGCLGFYLSKVYSYLFDDPKACVNCHIMTPHYATWFHSSHRERATCNDCHVPHDNLIRALWFKMSDGLRHANVFTLGSYPQVIRIRETGASVVQENCLRCHSFQVNFVSISQITYDKFKAGEGKLCWDCHREIPHGRISSQASTPYARVPELGPSLPNWILQYLNK